MIARLRRANVRTRLTFWYITALAVILFVYSAAVYALLRNHLFTEIDRKLREDIEFTEEVLSESPENPHALDDTKSRDRWLLEVWSQGRGKLFASPSSETSPLGDVGPECEGKRTPPTTRKLADGLYVRVACRTSRIDGRAYTIRSVRSADRVHEELDQVLLMLMLGLPAALLLSAFGGYLLARRALAPVSRMTEQAQNISVEKMGARLAIENPDDELGRLGTTFNQTFERLERSFEQMRRFSADASHELRTPLTAIRTMGEVALREDHSIKDYQEVISSVLEETDRLRHLVDSLLTLSRADAGQLKLNFNNESLSDLVKEVSHHLEVLAEEKGQILKLDLDPTVTALVDRTVLRQAVINLIDNAIKYGSPDTEILVRVFQTTSEKRIEIVDRGLGISDEHKDKVFDRFYRIDKARTRDQGGTGLGLSIAQWAANVNHGKIELHSEPGKGSTFSVVLP